MKRQLVGHLKRPQQPPERVNLFVESPATEWTVITRSVSETITSDSTYSDDAELYVAVTANETYMVHFSIFFDTTAAADFKFQFTGPNSPTAVAVRGSYVAVDGTTYTDFADSAFSTSHAVTGGASSVFGHVHGYIYAEIGATGGAIRLQWAQNTSDASNTTLYAGSFLEYIQIPPKEYRK